MLRDRIVLGIRYDSLIKKLISQGNTLTLDQAVRICKSSKVTSTVMQSVTQGASSGSVDAISKAQSRYPNYKQSKPSRTHKQGSAVQLPTNSQMYKPTNSQDHCKRCGREPHSKADCPAKDAQCKKCKEVGHFQRQCRGRSIQEVTEAGSDESIMFTGEFKIENLTMDAWKAEVAVNGNPTTFKLDNCRWYSSQRQTTLAVY